MNVNASSAASSCARIATSDTPGWSLMSPSAPTPVTYVAIETLATTKKTVMPTRFRPSCQRARPMRKMTSPTRKPDRRHVIQHDVQMCRIRKKLLTTPAPNFVSPLPCSFPVFVLVPFQAAHRTHVRQQAARGDRPEPADQRRDRQHPGVGRERPIRCPLRPEYPRLNHPLDDHAKRDEHHLDQKIRVRHFRRGVGHQKDRPGHGVDPERDPQHRQELFQRRERQRRGEAENPKIDDHNDADEDGHSVGVKEENRRKREQ